MPPAVAYGAKSTRDEKGSIPAQLADCRALAERDGLEIVAEFSDEAMSAWSGDRGSGLANARKAAERLVAEHGTCVFIIQHSDRMARGDGIQAAHLVEYALWAIKAGVQIRSVQDPQTFSDLLYAVVTGQRNSEDSRRKSLAVQSGMKRRAESGKHPGGPRRFGYRYVDGGLVHVPAEIAVVRRIFAEFAAGASLSAIGRGLQADGLRTAQGAMWRSKTVSDILGNPLYVGKVRSGDEVFPGQHEPAVDAETFEQARALLAARSSRGRGRPPKGHHLFRGGKLRCGQCGEAMTPRTNSRSGYETYSCNGRSEHGAAFCDMPHLTRSKIDGAVYSYFEQVSLDLDETRRTIEEAQSRKLTEIRALRGEAEHEAQRAAGSLARVRRDYLEGKLGAEDWTAFRDELAAGQQAADAEASRLAASEAAAMRDGDLVDAETEMLERLTEIRRAIAGEVHASEDVDAVRAALTRLFEGFVIRRGVPGRVHVELVGSKVLWIEPLVRERTVDGEALQPVLRAGGETADRWPVFSGILVA